MLRFTFYSLLSLAILGLIAAAAILGYIVPQLPPVDSLRDVQLQTPLRVYSRDQQLIAEFGEKRRLPVAVNEVPDLMKQAFIAAEDDRFYSHPGVDWMAITRAVIELVQTGQKRQGGSTITMQVARNFFLSREKTYERKLKEIVLAMIIERELDKEEILELYLNKIFLGHRAYGVGAAAQVYYGKALSELTLAEIATIAGLPKAPSTTNPISHPNSARDRRAYVLGRMRELGYIDSDAYDQANEAAIAAEWHGQAIESYAPHVAEMVRDFMLAQYGDAAYTAGLKVITTLDSRLQESAVTAVRDNLLAYDFRHGYRGPESHLEITDDDPAELDRILRQYPTIGDLKAALVIAVEEKKLIAWTRAHGAITIPWDGLSWAREYLRPDARGPRPKSADELAKAGDVIRVIWHVPATEDEADDNAAVPGGYWRLAQLPKIEGALVSLDPNNGAVRSLVGGFDFKRSKFNRIVQAKRQPGSNFKPFIYSAALERGYTAASFVNDAPIVFDAPGLESAWRPENYSGKYFGPTRLRVALTKSRNLVSIRLLRAIGVDYALNYVSRFGFNPQSLPGNLSMALGSGEVTPIEVVTGYATLANGGYRVSPYFVERVEDKSGTPIFVSKPATVCEICDKLVLDDEGEPADLDALMAMESAPPENRAERAISAENAWIMNSILHDVIKFGTGRKARTLGRKDIGGKTGTTNDQKDAWFSGFNRNVVTTVWVGFDQVAPLGKRETGAQAALPMWIDYMRSALADTPEATVERPPGLVTVRIDPATGLLASANHPDAIFESFRQAHLPARGDPSLTVRPKESSNSPVAPEQLF